MELDYSDERKAIAHDQDRFAWEHESGFAYASLSEGFTFDETDLSSALSDGYEQGFSRGWDAAIRRKRTILEKVAGLFNKKENNK